MSSVDGIMSGVPVEASSPAKDTMQPDNVNQEEATSLQPGQDTLMDIIETTDVQEDTELVDPDMEESAKSPQAAVLETIEVKDVTVPETATRAAAAPVSSAIPQDLEMIMNMVVDGGNVGGSGRVSGDTQMAGTAEVESDSDDESSEGDSSSDSGSESDPEVESDSSASSTKSSIRGPPPGPSQSSTSTPMSRETRDRLMAQLTTFYETGDAGGSRFAGEDGLDENGEGYVTADSDELEEEGEVDMGLGWEAASGDEGQGKGRFVEVDDDDEDEDEEDSSDEDDGPAINLMEMEDSDDEAGGAGGPSEPPKTKHEVEDDRAVVPEVQVLPDGERLVLAGEVMSVILHVKPVETTEVQVEVNSRVSKVEGEEQGVAEASLPDHGLQAIKDATAGDAAVDDIPSVTDTAVPVKPPNPGPKQTKAMKQKAKKEQKQQAKSSGTIVVKALRPPLETEGLGGLRIGDDEGWLEEGSVICLEDRRVLAVVAETFGPLSQPFYLLRLPPAPYPLPPASSLMAGTKVYYPASGNRSFVPVRMLKTDKRYKGTDASNLHDEEVSESEREWSDDEAEREAKRQRKSGKARANTERPDRTRHWDAGAEGEAFDEDREFLDYAQDPVKNVDDDGRSMAGMSTVSTRGGRTGPVRYDDIVPYGSADSGRGSSGANRGSRGGAPRGRGRGGAGMGSESSPRHGERTRDQRGRGRGEARGAGGRGGAGRGGRGGAMNNGPSRNQDGGRQIGQGSGRGRGRGQAPSTFGSPGAAHGRPEQSREMSPTSLAIARATSQAPVLPQATGFAQPMSAPMHMPQMQQQPYGQQQNAPIMGMPFGWQGQGNPGMQMPQMPYYYMPMQQQNQQAFGGAQQYQGMQQGAPGQGAFNPAFAARMMGMGMGGMNPQQFQQPQPQSQQQQRTPQNPESKTGP